MRLGKYSTDRDSALHFLCASEWSNASFGDVESPTGFIHRISNKLEEVHKPNTEITSVLEDWFTSEEVEDTTEFRKSLVGHFLLVEDNQGFVSVHEYPTEALLIQAFESLEEIYSEWDSQDDDDSDYGHIRDYPFTD